MIVFDNGDKMKVSQKVVEYLFDSGYLQEDDGDITYYTADDKTDDEVCGASY